MAWSGYSRCGDVGQVRCAAARTFDDLIKAARLQEVHRVEAQGCLHGFSNLAQVRDTLQAIW